MTVYDLVIRGGSIVDGTGNAPFVADIAVIGGIIVAIGSGLSGHDVLEADGCIVAPGFIDIHTHYDPQILWDRQLTPSCWHGVTSAIAGNCGFSVAPVRAEGRDILIGTLEKVEDMDGDVLRAGVDWDFESYGDYLAAVERRKPVINFGGYVGHTAVRLYVMGDASYEREATADELASMKAVVVASLRDGALGFSTDRAGFILGHGGKPVPSVVASQDETETLMAVVAEEGRGIANIAPGENYAWLPDFQRRAGCTVNWSAILTYPESSGRDHHGKLRTLAAARADGGDMWAQVTCRPIVQQISLLGPYSFSHIPAFARIIAAAPADRAALYRSEAWRAELAENLTRPDMMQPRWELIRVAESEANPQLIGRTIKALAQECGQSPFDVMCDLALEDDLATRFSVTFANDDEAAVADLLITEGCIVGLSDAGAHASQICDAVLPTDFLSRWVRDRKLMSVESGIRKLTGELADILRIDRGYLRVGAPADIVTIDLDALSTGPIRLVRDLPAGGERLIADAPTGIVHVVVNGVPIRRDGQPDPAGIATGPGRILRNS